MYDYKEGGFGISDSKRHMTCFNSFSCNLSPEKRITKLVSTKLRGWKLHSSGQICDFISIFKLFKRKKGRKEEDQQQRPNVAFKVYSNGSLALSGKCLPRLWEQLEQSDTSAHSSLLILQVFGVSDI